MPATQLLRRLGVFIIEEFISADECESLCSEMRLADTTEAKVLTQSLNLECIEKRIRQTQYCQISATSNKNINERLNELRPQLEVFFGNALASDFEKAKFLKYDPGDFFAPHTDAQYRRKINITINLNTSINATGEVNFEGGELQLYGLIKKPEFTNKGISAPSTAGCLIAYPCMRR